MNRKYLFALRATLTNEGKPVLTTEGNIMLTGSDPPTEDLVKEAVNKFCWTFNRRTQVAMHPLGPSDVVVMSMLPLEFVDNLSKTN